MSEVKSRQFSILDALILIAATAAGFAWWRILEPFGPFHGSLAEVSLAGSLRSRLYRAAWGLLDLYPVMVPWTFGWLLLRLRSPRPGLRRIARQPGFAAECAVLAALAVQVGELARWRIAGCGLRHFTILTLRGQSLIEMLDNGLRLDETIKQIASAVGSLWGLMFLGRVLRPERSWIDRGGRALGVLWLVMYLIRIGTMESD
jgi:hypothetical protein